MLTPIDGLYAYAEECGTIPHMTDTLNMRKRGRCQVCTHPERARLELLLAAGSGYRETARKFDLDEDAVARHWKRHVSEAHRKAMAPGAAALAARFELAGQIAEENTSSLEHLKAARAVLWRMWTAELSKGHTVTAAAAGGHYVKVCGLIAKLTGELATSPLVQTTNLHLHFADSPEFQALMDDVAAALEPYPDARRAVFERLAAIERPDARVIDMPALVHDAHAAA